MSEPVGVQPPPRSSRGGRPRELTRAVPIVVATAIGATALAGSAQAAPQQDAPDDVRPRTSRAVAHLAHVTARVVTLAAPVRPLAAAGATYTVRAGDTVSHIAQRLGTTVAAVVAANGLDSRAFIREGQVLSIPSAATAPAAAAAPAANPSGQHTVRRGDTVGGIAARYGTTTSAVVAANGLDSRAFIREGQVLSVPGAASAAPAPAAAPAAPAAAPAASYTVRSGDTLGGIAARSGTTVAALRSANPGLDGRGTIRIGQTLAVPGAAAPAVPVASTFEGRTYPASTTQAATANRDTLAGRDVPSRDAMRGLVADTARAHGVDPALAQAVAFQESGFNMRAVSPANAVGAMQVIPSSGVWASELAGRPIDLLDPADNALAGVLILRAHARTGADQATVIASYYQGMASVRRNGMYSDTRRYVANVQTLMAQYR